MSVMHCLLTDPLISVQVGEHYQAEWSLPQVFAALSSESEADAITSFLHLQAHQSPLFHAFLAQVGAICARRFGWERLPRQDRHWHDALLTLAEGPEPWCLWVEDFSQPAFLQPPVPEGHLDGFKRQFTTPDQLDVLVNAKNHDTKGARIRHPRPEHWVFALLSLQTTEGYSGRANYGIIRMNGGLGARPFVSTIPGLDLGARFRRDVGVLRRARDRVAQTYGYPARGGHALLWLLPWQGAGDESLPATECDPWFVEICRRVRLSKTEGGSLTASMANTKAPRLTGPENGLTGDPWTPVDVTGKSLTVSPDGLTYKLVRKLLFTDGYEPAPAQIPVDEDGDQPWFLASVLVRGQGRTDGFHRRPVPIPRKMATRLRDASSRSRLGQIAQNRVDAASAMRNRVLHVALCALLQGGPTDLTINDKRTRPYLNRLERAVDDAFFPRLWADLQEHGEDSYALDIAWASWLKEQAEEVLEHARQSAPIPAIRRYRAYVASSRVFHFASKKNFPDLFPEGDGHADARPPA